MEIDMEMQNEVSVDDGISHRFYHDSQPASIVVKIQKLLPRRWVRVILFIVGIISLFASFIQFALCFIDITAYNIIKGAILFLALLTLGAFLLITACLQKKYRKFEKGIAGVTVAVFVLVMTIYFADILVFGLVKVIQVIIIDAEEYEEFGHGVALEDKQGFDIIFALIFGSISCCICMFCCCPAFGFSVVNLIHAIYPESEYGLEVESREEGEDMDALTSLPMKPLVDEEHEEHDMDLEINEFQVDDKRVGLDFVETEI